MSPGDADAMEAVARQMKAEGYNGPVVARRLIAEHGMEEGAAVALVSRLFGHRVDPRAGNKLLAGLGLVAYFGGLLAFVEWYLRQPAQWRHNYGAPGRAGTGYGWAVDVFILLFGAGILLVGGWWRALTTRERIDRPDGSSD